MAAVDTFRRSFLVGRYRVEYHAQIVAGAPISLECRWSLRASDRLSPVLLREYQRQRDRVLAALVQRLGGLVASVAVLADGRLQIWEVKPDSDHPSKEGSTHG